MINKGKGASSGDKPTPFRPQLGDEIEGMLTDFCAAHHEANMSAVVRKAVRDFIIQDLAVNSGARAVYTALQEARSKGRGAATSLFTGEKPDDGQQQ